ncbi:MAG: DUF5675 family protein [Candidatus Heimdallarchaeaceae archaeon]
MLPIVELIRLEENFQYGTFGVIKINKQVFCICLEPADLENRRNVSSIPVQQYICERYSSVKYTDTFQVMNVPDRDLILWHPGNLIKHTEGCILVAQHYGKLRGNRAVLNSGKTFAMFMKLMEGTNKFHLTIQEYY